MGRWRSAQLCGCAVGTPTALPLLLRLQTSQRGPLISALRWLVAVCCRPPPTIPDTEELRQWSKRMALAAPATFFKPQAGL
jgi:hypothetical protein